MPAYECHILPFRIKLYNLFGLCRPFISWRHVPVFDLLAEENRRNPYPMYDAVREVSPVLKHPQADIWMIFDYEGVKRAMSDPDAFSSRATPPGGYPLDWLLFLDPPRHTKLRALINKAFTPRSIANLEPRIKELSRELLDPVIERGEMDLVTDYALPLPMMVIAEMLGVPVSDRPRFRRWNDVLLNMIYTVTGGDAALQAMQNSQAATVEMGEYLTGQLAQRRAAPRDDLLTRLLNAEVDGAHLTEKEILDFFQVLLLAGSETTTNLINNAMLCFLEWPDQLALLRKTPSLLPSAIEEVLRFRSPVQVNFRQSKHDIEMHGQTIPAGKLVLAMTGSANRDPKAFHEPARFDITRNPNPHLGFGHGLHFCLGAPLSRLEGRITLTDLLERLPGFALASDKPWQPREAFHVHGPTRLPVKFQAGRRN
jgi:cytochrome P450